jgi:hypothetical protein
MMDLPADFVRTQHELYGDQGVAWLADLPNLIRECEQRWSLTVQRHVDGLSYNFVAPAVRADGVQLMLKLSVPNKELTTEIEALRLYDGRGICRLIDADAERGILLLERLQPGVMLSTIEDDTQATVIAAAVMRQLWRPAPNWSNRRNDCILNCWRPRRNRCCCTATCITSISSRLSASPGWPLTPKAWWANRRMNWVHCCATPPTNWCWTAASRRAGSICWPTNWDLTASVFSGGELRKPCSLAGGAMKTTVMAGRQ